VCAGWCARTVLAGRSELTGLGGKKGGGDARRCSCSPRLGQRRRDTELHRQEKQRQHRIGFLFIAGHRERGVLCIRVSLL
jgi:hypothetical protein